MGNKGNAASVGSTGGAGNRATAGNRLSTSHSITNAQQAQEPRAPLGTIPPAMRGALICIGGQHVASVHGRVLRRTFDGTRELLSGSLAFRVDVLDLATAAGAQEIEAKDRSTGQVWRISITDFRAKAWPYNHRLYGKQLALQLAKWGPEQAPDLEPETPVQLDLFGAVAP